MTNSQKTVVRRFIKKHKSKEAARLAKVTPVTLMRVLNGEGTHVSSRSMVEQWADRLLANFEAEEAQVRH